MGTSSKRHHHHVDSLLASNPRADAATVHEGLRLLDELFDAGVKDHVYNLASPYGRSVHSVDEGMWNMATNR